MKRQGFLLLVAVVCMVLSVAGNAVAGHRAGSFMLSPGIGQFGFDSDLDLQDSTAGGLSLGYNITENIGLDASYYYANTVAKSTPLDRDGDSADGDVHFYQLGAAYNFMTDKKIVPYIAAGAGVFHYNLDKIDGDNDTAEFATNVGGGVKCFVHNSIALFADVRSVQTYPESNWLGTVGVTFYMGGCEKKAEAAAPAPQPVAAAEPVDQEKLAFEKEDIYFAFDKSDLTADSQTILKRKAAYLSNNPDAAVTIEGHCDERGTNEYNIALGERRATSARDFLVNLGTDLTRLTTISYGEERPVDPGHSEDAWTKNRRAHFVLK